MISATFNNPYTCNIRSRYSSWTYTGIVFDGCIVLMSNMVGVKNKHWNNMVVCVRIVAASEQCVRLVMYEGRRTEA